MDLVVAHTTTEAKRSALARIAATNLEGVVFKHLASMYDGGRSQAALKFKLVEDSTFIVLAHNLQRSVQIGVLDLSDKMIPVGNVTVPVSAQMPPVDSLLDVQYLYYNPGGGLEQPVFKGVRSDVTRDDANIAQISRVRPAGAAPAGEADDEPPAMSSRERMST
jgi:hypothetical protein